MLLGMQDCYSHASLSLSKDSRTLEISQLQYRGERTIAKNPRIFCEFSVEFSAKLSRIIREFSVEYSANFPQILILAEKSRNIRPKIRGKLDRRFAKSLGLLPRRFSSNEILLINNNETSLYFGKN